MHRNRESASILVRFLDNFLREQNIKWMLGVGTLILLGSSLRLVSTHWEEYTPFWKYGILLLYTVAIFSASQISYFRLGLQRTGTVLMILTVLLIPISFFSLHWIRPAGALNWSDLPQQAGLVLLLGMNLILSAVATHRIFVHFLRRPQLTFEFCYLALCLAGAVAPGLPQSWSPGMTGLLWLLFIAGTVKVNRHVFWLCEELRQPRVFGFVPILLLGAQFLGLFAINFAASFQMQWWGLACAMVAVPILMTSDIIARVFQQRTGDLVRPLPGSIVVPLIVGLVFCAAGLCFAATGFPRPDALVPTAALSAVALGVVAQRTRLRAFTWTGIACLLLAYQFSPLFFLEFARSIVQSGAATVKESRLPYAFYGLTYLPVLLGFLLASVFAQRHRKDVFAIPLRQAAIGLAGLLLAAALGHPKATFPVALTMAGVFSLQAVCFHDRRLLIPVNLALVGATWGFHAFQTTVLERSLIPASPFLHFAILGLLQLVPGRWIDQWSLRLDRRNDEANLSPWICQQFSLSVTVIASVIFGITALQHTETSPPLLTTLILGSLLVVHALLNMDSRLGLMGVIFANVMCLPYWISLSLSWKTSLLSGVIFLMAQWISGALLRRVGTGRVAKTFSQPLCLFSGLMQQILLAGIIIPALVSAHFEGRHQSLELWIASALMALWCLASALETGKKRFAIGSFFILLGLPGAILSQQWGVHFTREWLPLLWSSLAAVQLGTLKVAERWLAIRTDADVEPFAGPSSLLPFQILKTIIPGLWCCVALGTLAWLGVPARLAAMVAIAGLLWKENDGQVLMPAQASFCLANWQVLCLLTGLLTGASGSLLQLSQAQVFDLAIPLALSGALSALGIEAFLFHQQIRQCGLAGKEILQRQQFLMLVVSIVMLTIPCLNQFPDFTGLQKGVLVTALASLVLCQLICGCREQSTGTIWQAEAIAVLAFCYLAALHVVDFSLSGGMFILLGLSLLLWGIGRRVQEMPMLRVMADPFLTTAYWLPTAVAAVAISRHALMDQGSVKGFNTLALLIASAFYFFQGMQHYKLRNWWLSATILNSAIALLWRELHWHDAQLFLIPIGASVLLLVELLWKEIPEQLHDPLRYAGALTILVSPTFEIMSGSWLHLLSLMVLSVIIVLLAIGLRVRSLVYTGTAFLIADLVAMLVRGSLDHPNLLWGCGVVLGMAVMGLAAYCEHHRETLQSRIRLISAELESWR